MNDPAKTAAPDTLRRTPLYDLHVELGARMSPFAGYEMPIHYPLGVMKEHLHTRAAIGLFDVSHMGQFRLRARAGGYAELARALETLLPVDVLGLRSGRQRYGFFTNDGGGVLDDLMLARLDDEIFLVSNAARKAADETLLRERLSQRVEIETLDRSLIAVQGPGSESALAGLAPELKPTQFMDAREEQIMGVHCVATRSGYTGEDGFELSVPNAMARDFVVTLLAMQGVAPIGLGARDSLRLEAGLCLYGADMDDTTSPIEADLAWAIPKCRRRDGARGGGFPGAERILNEIETGAPRRRVGLLPEGRAPVRAGAAIFANEKDVEPIGRVSSGGFGPNLDAPISMGYLPTALATPGTTLHVELRGKKPRAQVAELPFIRHRYKRA